MKNLEVQVEARILVPRLWILEEDPPDCFCACHLHVKEAHDENGELC